MQIKQFLVLPKLPEKLKHLQELSQNLWYSWNPELVRLFRDLDETLWESTNQNPVEMLATLPQDILKKAAENEQFLDRLEQTYEKLQQYLDRKNWFHFKYGQYDNQTLAYFSLEYGLDTGLPVYSGGLGVLSGDTLKAASDLGIPMVAVGLLYRYGYFRQQLSNEGWQQERYEENDWYHMPVQRVKDKNEKPLQISVELDGQIVHLQVWKVTIGRIPLYLLDANIPDNSPKIRDITSVLYGGDKEMRIRQEIVLGVGGVRALKALGINPAAY
ncbi:MAG TPA: alpha-glucan family phosphorylase, partial [candidate division Zixibacteria bacterium]|nr:alpha-glucan family phosphorylase [candidate division Zixibacteria bacterium]